jgi:hypothetical protein
VSSDVRAAEASEDVEERVGAVEAGEDVEEHIASPLLCRSSRSHQRQRGGGGVGCGGEIRGR